MVTDTVGALVYPALILLGRINIPISLTNGTVDENVARIVVDIGTFQCIRAVDRRVGLVHIGPRTGGGVHRIVLGIAIGQRLAQVFACTRDFQFGARGFSNWFFVVGGASLQLFNYNGCNNC